MNDAPPLAALPSPLRGAHLRHELYGHVTVDAGDARELVRPRVLSERARLLTGVEFQHEFKRQGQD